MDGICKCRVGTVEIFLINLRNKVGHRFKITEKNHIYIGNNIKYSQCLLCCNLCCDHCRLINIWQRKELQHFGNNIKFMMNFPPLQYQTCHLMDKMKIITMVCLLNPFNGFIYRSVTMDTCEISRSILEINLISPHHALFSILLQYYNYYHTSMKCMYYYCNITHKFMLKKLLHFQETLAIIMVFHSIQIHNKR